QELQQLRLKILQKYKVATTLGYGPRFLHSTGQLHKGDSGNGFFIQFVSEIENDLPIPDEAGREGSSISFGTLIKSQALGDRQALIDNNRRVLTVDLGKNDFDWIV
ncbi:MAG: pgi, partial [Ignavibacteriaceae bacterium]|nr:pgi [Ignavibacteriaceae bacterium]